MDNSLVLWITLLLGMLGLIVVGGVVWFGYVLTERAKSANVIFPHPFWDEFIHHWMKRSPGSYEDIPRYLHDSYAEYLTRRNEFWTTYGQVLLAVLIVVVLAILLVTKTISAEAGLPILSGISGFAIAKGISGARNVSMPQDRRPTPG